MRTKAPEPNTTYSPKWHKREITQELKPYGSTIKVFHQLHMGRISAAVYLTGMVFGRVFLQYDDSIRHSNFEMYSIRIGSVDGMSVGYLFRSPLAIRADPYYVMFYRRGLDVVEDVLKSPTPAEKKYVFSNLVFHVHDCGYLITRLENNSVTKMLGS